MSALAKPRLAADLPAIAKAAGTRLAIDLIDAAAILCADPTFVRKLIKLGEIEAYTLGVRAIRIYADSVADYQRRQTIGVSAPAPRKKQRRSAAHIEALANLETLGISTGRAGR